MKYKLGDTLIEVTLAVGIFSMVAIAIAAVMNGSTSSSQAALETTLAREEIDAQAEALRFIQDAYLADENMKDDRFEQLWNKITSNAIAAGTTSYNNYFKKYGNPGSCNEVYTNTANLFNQKAFIIDTRKLQDYSIATTTPDVDNVYIPAENNSANRLIKASTHPRLTFSEAQSKNEDSLINNTGDSLYRAEGIYVVAVKGDCTGVNCKPNYYDFYIRTCWFGPGDDIPTSISTLVRLYNPKAISNPLPTPSV